MKVAAWAWLRKEPGAARLVAIVAFSLSSLRQTLLGLHRWHVGKKLPSLWSRGWGTFSKTYNSTITCFWPMVAAFPVFWHRERLKIRLYKATTVTTYTATRRLVLFYSHVDRFSSFLDFIYWFETNSDLNMRLRATWELIKLGLWTQRQSVSCTRLWAEMWSVYARVSPGWPRKG